MTPTDMPPARAARCAATSCSSATHCSQQWKSTRSASSVRARSAPGAAGSVWRGGPGKDRTGRAHPQVEVTFLPGKGRSGGARAFDFHVDCESRISGVVRTVASSRVYSPNALLPAEKDVAPVACRFAEEAIPGCGEVRFTVRPVNEWGKFGPPLATDWTPAG